MHYRVCDEVPVGVSHFAVSFTLHVVVGAVVVIVVGVIEHILCAPYQS